MPKYIERDALDKLDHHMIIMQHGISHNFVEASESNSAEQGLLGMEFGMCVA